MPIRIRFVLTFSVITLWLLICGTAAPAQFYSAGEGRSPLELLSVPLDGADYYRAKMKVRSLVRNDRLPPQGEARLAAAQAAEPLAERLVRDYPRDPENWLLLATAKKALKKHGEAARAYERWGSIAGWEPLAGWYAAESYLAAGDRKLALDMIRRHIFEHRTMDRDLFYTADEFAGLRSDPEFLKLVGRAPAPDLSRDQGWKHDLDFLIDEVKRVNPVYRDIAFPPNFFQRYSDLKRRIPSLSDEEIVVGINAMLATLHQGHTEFANLGNEGSRLPNDYLPVQLYLFPEGVFVVNAAEPFKNLIGSKVVTLGKLPALEAWRRVNAIQSVDGDMEYVGYAGITLTKLSILKGLGVIDASGPVRVDFESPAGGRETVMLPPSSSAWQLPAAEGTTAPILRRDADKRYWEKLVPEYDALYIRFDSVRDDRNETLASFGKRLWGLISDQKPKNVILDLRVNTGGSAIISYELLRTLIAFDRVPGNRLYILIGRRTYSAAGLFLNQLEPLADPIFVGEATSECCRINSEPSNIVLPYSKVGGRVATLQWNLSTAYDKRREISPDLPIQLSARDYFAGKDPALAIIYRLIEEDRAVKPKDR